jgi:hypothetical protein
MAFLSYDSKEWNKAKEYFDTAYFVSFIIIYIILEIKADWGELLSRDVPHQLRYSIWKHDDEFVKDHD